MHPGKILQSRRVPTKPCNRKYASTVVTGRSFAAKRAIARRVANYNSQKSSTTNTISFNYCCNYPTVTGNKNININKHNKCN
jgi:hypothetical protein